MKDSLIVYHNNKDFLIADPDNKDSIVVEIQAKLRRSRSFLVFLFLILFTMFFIFQQTQISVGSRKGQQYVKTTIQNVFPERPGIIAFHCVV